MGVPAAGPVGGPDSGNRERPVGWWLKEADRRLDGAFDRALEGRGCDRRGWQILASLARRPVSRDRLAELLAPFDAPAAVERAIGGLTERGLVEEDAGLLRLTKEGIGMYTRLSGPVEDVRRQVRAALPEEDYAVLVTLLGRLAAALPPPGEVP